MSRLIGILILLLLPQTGWAHGEGVYSCNTALKQSFPYSKAHPIPPIIRIVTAHYETDDIGILAWWGPHNKDPQNNARVKATGRGEDIIYREFGLTWKKRYPELIMRPASGTWERGVLYWLEKDTPEIAVGSFTCSIYLSEF